MGNFKSLALLALLFSFSVVFAETSNEATNAKNDVKPNTEATDKIEPQQRGGCRYGCCGAYAYGQCAACCSRPQTAEANDVVVEPQVSETESVEANVVDPQQRGVGGGSGWGGGGGCRYGCCGGWRYGRCNYCCTRPQAEADVVEPQQRGGCRYGCCGSYAFGRCSACCSRPQTTETKVEANDVVVEPQALEAETVEANVVDPQHHGGGGGCRYGCCGGWHYGRCNYCCTRPQAEADVVEPQQRGGGCRYGCCGSYAFGRCSACCAKKMTIEKETKKEEAKP